MDIGSRHLITQNTKWSSDFKETKTTFPTGFRNFQLGARHPSHQQPPIAKYLRGDRNRRIKEVERKSLSYKVFCKLWMRSGDGALIFCATSGRPPKARAGERFLAGGWRLARRQEDGTTGW